jgi:catechol 2,3-dioxygenase-like lactoylglutathione lyase family enzyme
MQINGLDHFVLTVTDMDMSCDFYHRILGIEIIGFGDNRKALKIGEQKINLHEADREIQPCARQPVPGSADMCLIAETPIPEIVEQLDIAGINIELGPVQRTGAQGAMTSVYLRDPDGNLIELSNYY